MMPIPRKKNIEKGQDLGIFEVSLGIAGSPSDEPITVSATVDTGAIHSMIPASMLAQIGVQPVEQFIYCLADGSEVEYSYGMACLTLQGFAPFYCPVIFGAENQILVGATTLEIFNLMVDPVDGALIRRVARARPF